MKMSITTQSFETCEHKNLEYQDGVLFVWLNSWEEFIKIADIVTSDYVWRGHQDEKWELKSLYDRELEGRRIKGNGKDRDSILKSVMYKFRKRVNESTGNLSKLTEAEIWAVGQHHGLPTPFLDWTMNPYIAAYFAFRKKDLKDQSENRVIIALRRETKRLIRKTKSRTKVLRRDRYIEFPGLTESIDTSLNKRMKVQEGLFTKALNGRDILDNVTTYYNKKYRNSKKEEAILIKIFVPNNQRDECLRYLRTKKDIFDGRIFPDYSGAVEISRDEILEST
jgi:hypothetical protein